MIHTMYGSARTSIGSGFEGKNEEERSLRLLGVITRLGQGARLLQRLGGDRLPPAATQSRCSSEAICSTVVPVVCTAPDSGTRIWTAQKITFSQPSMCLEKKTLHLSLNWPMPAHWFSLSLELLGIFWEFKKSWLAVVSSFHYPVQVVVSPASQVAWLYLPSQALYWQKLACPMSLW